MKSCVHSYVLCHFEVVSSGLDNGYFDNIKIILFCSKCCDVQTFKNKVYYHE